MFLTELYSHLSVTQGEVLLFPFGKTQKKTHNSVAEVFQENVG